MIKIYRDEGVEKKCLPVLLHELSEWKSSFITSKDIIHSSWESQTSLLIIPGGRDVPYHQALKGEGNRRIRRFVENGGSFLGICAGAYYGCGMVEFDRGQKFEVVGTRELAFFPGIARGPAYGPGTFHYNSEAGARASLISDAFTNETFRTYHNGGCYFVDIERYPHIKILSKYLDIEDQPAAIIEVMIGKGKAILSGVHFEKGTSFQPSIFHKEMSQKLMKDEAKRKCFFNHIICSLVGWKST